MSDIIPFSSGNLPAYLQGKSAAALNDDLTSHAGSGFPIISIKGKIFTVVRDGERSVIPNPKDPDSPATNIDMVIIKANKGTSKVFYAKGYTEGAEAVKPDCFSNDGVRPDASIENPVAKSCATCPKNVFGAKIGENGKKSKACSDSVRIAVSTPDRINDPYFIRVPAASIRKLGEYGKELAKRGVAYNMVATKIGFDMESPTPLLTFKPVGFLPEATYEQVKAEMTSDTVQAILGGVVHEAAAETAAEVIEKAKAPMAKATTDVTADEIVAAVGAASEELAAKKSKPAAKKEEPAVASLADIDLDDLNFE